MDSLDGRNFGEPCFVITLLQMILDLNHLSSSLKQIFLYGLMGRMIFTTPLHQPSETLRFKSM